MRVVVLAGGKGTRLKPYTKVFPKPLMPIGDMSILEVVLRQLKSFGFNKITLSVNHLADLIRAFFGDGSQLGVDITYCMEDKPLGTAGSLSLVENLTDSFLVMNGDLLTTIDYAAMVRRHIESGMIATIGVFPREVQIDFGVLEIGAERELLDYREKPTFEYMVSMGVNVFDKSVLEFIPSGKYLDIPTLMMSLKKAGKTVLTYSSDCEWLDIGRVEDYETAIKAFEQSRDKYLRA
ncbi:MAG: NTP transferase domain-containing protein [Phycisphaerae bacterium]|nr:NTP transferase domain-containing protein [Phycisphaerae bacterium]NIP54682.1 NTP transferase domain-containing protein [Phycisphaerae bacterium]NIS53551.1 NTP transferase domain-containing protein [Phycisphaerae bacterium]NIU11011.1 NTP transferase domain-containing protein [Phycisphaerae bacterium]NIU58894.1 NTP transferase domain-containing protein [Phycisphaerae bacterium]